MLSLWYIILGWKEYNKPFRRAEQPAKPVEPVKKPDLIPPRKDVPTLPTDIKKPQPPQSIPIDPKPPASRDPLINSKIPEAPKISDAKPNLPFPKTPEAAKIPEVPKTPEPPKSVPGTPELPKTTPKVPEPPKLTPKVPEPPKITPKTPESPVVTPKTPELPSVIPKTPERGAVAPKTPEPPKITPKTPEVPSVTPKTPEPPKVNSPKTPELPKTDSPKTPDPFKSLEGITPSRRPESVMPEFPSSGKNPFQSNPSEQTEFPLPPYLPGTQQNKPLSRDDELFALGSNFNNPNSNKPIGNLRDLSYAKGEFSGENEAAKIQDAVSKLPKYMEQSVISNPDSLESDEEDVEF